jgi:hypothetical protein
MIDNEKYMMQKSIEQNFASVKKDCLEIINRKYCSAIISLLKGTVWVGNLDLVKLFIDNGVNIDLYGMDGCTNLFAVIDDAKGGKEIDLEMIKLLLNAGANPIKACIDPFQSEQEHARYLDEEGGCFHTHFVADNQEL